MLRHITYILILMMLMLAGCSDFDQHQHDKDQAYQVAVIFSYDSLMSCYHAYDSVMEQEFKRAGINVNLHRVYLDSPNREDTVCINSSMLDSLGINNIDLLISEGDFACQHIMRFHRDAASKCPTIVGGLSVPDWSKMQGMDSLYVWYHIPDYKAILHEISRLTGQNIVVTELDNHYLDSLLYNQVSASLDTPPFVNFLHYDEIDLSKLNNIERTCSDSIAMVSISYENPTPATESLVSIATKYPQLEIKGDLFSYNAMHVSRSSSFTCLPYLFATSQHDFTAGYFVTMETQAHDVTETAIKILRGKASKVHRANIHKAQWLVDYELMEGVGLDLKNARLAGYEVVGVPFEELHPYFSGFARGILIFILTLAVLVFAYNYFWDTQRDLHGKLRHMQPSNYRLLGRQCSVFHYIEGGQIEVDTYNEGEDTQTICFPVDQFFSVVLPESQEAAEQFKAGLVTPGRYSVDMYISFNEGVDCHWWRYRFISSKNRRIGKVETHGVLMLIDDEKHRIEERDKTKKLVEEMQNKEKFLNSMNHEIRTPLNAVLGCSQLLAMPDVEMSEDERAQLLNNMKQAEEQLMSLVQDILSYSRLGSGRMKLQMEPMMVDEMMGGLYAIYERHIHRNPLLDENDVDKTGLLSLAYHPGASGLCISIDNSYIQQIFTHLMSNAIKFTPQGEIRMGWFMHMTEQEVEIYVEDSGLGMPKNKLEHMWSAFYKSDSGTSGLGLGLTLVRTMTEQMNGRVKVDSSEGIGSRFSLIFPIVKS